MLRHYSLIFEDGCEANAMDQLSRSQNLKSRVLCQLGDPTVEFTQPASPRSLYEGTGLTPEAGGFERPRPAFPRPSSSAAFAVSIAANFRAPPLPMRTLSTVSENCITTCPA